MAINGESLMQLGTRSIGMKCQNLQIEQVEMKV